MLLRGARRPGRSDLDEFEEGREAIRLPEGTLLQQNIAYGSHPKQQLDVYKTGGAASSPIIFMVHGGAWMAGDKCAHRVVQRKISHWLPRGYIFVSVNYRLLPEAGPLEQANDVAAALAYTQRNAAAWGGDSSRLLVMGHSSGAHLLALLCSDSAISTAQNAGPWLGAILLDSACMDVVSIMQAPHRPLYDHAFGRRPQYWQAASPLHRLGREAPAPMMIVCSSLREDSCGQAQAYAGRVNSLGGRANVLPMSLTHADINGELGSVSAYTAAVDAFIRSLGLP
jgi:acetyl esterase/lipase